MRRRSGYLWMAAVISTFVLAPAESGAQRCFPCYLKPNPKDRNPDRRDNRPDTLETPDGRDSYTRPTELPGHNHDARDFVPPQDIIRSVPGDVAPDEVLPPPSDS
ncbi:MAG: hypothetical protein V4718_07875 [Pseudomonadota bacterium]